MRVYRAKDHNDMSRKAANIIPAKVTLKPDCVLGLATGSSPIGTCKQPIEWYEKGDSDFSQVKSAGLDKYKSLTKDNDQSYYYFMYNSLFKHINIDLNSTNVSDGTEPDSEKEYSRCDKVVEGMGGADLQLLGLGHNGHTSFNEPEDTLPKLTHCVDLQESTIEADKRFLVDINGTPRQAHAMGTQTIMRARTTLMVVSGEDKAQILCDVLCGPIIPHVPASILQFHNDVIIVADEVALSKMPK